MIHGVFEKSHVHGIISNNHTIQLCREPCLLLDKANPIGKFRYLIQITYLLVALETWWAKKVWNAIVTTNMFKDIKSHQSIIL